MRVDIESERGEQFTLPGVITKGTPAAPFPVGSWANYVVLFTAKRKRTDVAPLVQKDTALIGGVAKGPDGTGTYTVSIVTADTSGFTVTELLVYDVQLIEPDGTRTVVAKGTWRVRLAVGS